MPRHSLATFVAAALLAAALPSVAVAQTVPPDIVGTGTLTDRVEVKKLPLFPFGRGGQPLELRPPYPVIKPEPGSIAPVDMPEIRPESPVASRQIRPTISFAGPSGSGLEPPDPDVAVGSSDLILSTNGSIQVFSKTGTALTGLISPSTFFGVPSGFNIQSDPKFIYDAESGRYFGVWIAYNSTTNTGAWFVVVSDTSSATGSFSRYSFTQANQLPDYPGLGICSDKLILTANNFQGPNFTSFTGAVAVAINKSQLVAGQSNPNFNAFLNIRLNNNNLAFTIQAAESNSPTTTCHMISLRGTNSVQLYRITGLPSGSSASAQTTGAAENLTTAVSTPPDARQRNSNRRVETNDTRLLDASYRSVNGGSIWTASTTGCNIGGTVYSCANLVEVQGVDTTSPTLRRQITVGLSGSFYYFPTVRADENNNAVAIFSRSSTSEFPSLRSIVCPNTGSCLSSTQLVGGTAPYTGTRWGDYFGAAVDPTAPGTVWVYGEYKGSTGSLWQTFTGSVTP